MSGLQAPRIQTEDPGAHELSDSEDHFSSASEGNADTPQLSVPRSPIPQTRVERVDDQPAHGEVPGTPAYEQRRTDAVPDEIEIIPEGRRSRAMSSLSQTSRPQTPVPPPIPKTVVERVDDKPAYGEVEGTAARELRLADATPDEVRDAPLEAKDGRLHGRDGTPVDPQNQQAWFRSMWGEESGANGAAVDGSKTHDAATHDEDDDDDDDNEEEGDVAGANVNEDDPGDDGDEFDEFAEEGGEDDFGDFDEAEDAFSEEGQDANVAAAATLPMGLPPLDITGLSQAEVEQAFEPYFDAIFRPTEESQHETSNQSAPPSIGSAFISDRSLSLWQQLVSPPPMQPPNWTRSRIRRLFLVSLGVPVDLDEILPPSKQKRLVLPNIELSQSSPRPSAALDRLKENAANNSSTTSVDSKGVPRRPKAHRATSRGPPPPPEFDANAASLLCSTTSEAMSSYTDGELQQHILTLTALNEKASAVLEYWLQRKDDGMKEKEALEGVIENLVGFVKGRRGK